MPSRNPADKIPPSDNTEKPGRRKPLNFEIDFIANKNQNVFSSTNQPDPGPLGRKSEWRPGKPWDPAWGEKPIKKAGRPKKEDSLTDLITIALDEKVDVYYGDGRMERLERKKIWARHLADLAVFGQVALPSPDQSGSGRIIKFSADSYAKHALKMLRFLEPPVPEAINPSGVTNIIFDVPIQLPVQVMETTSRAPEIVIIDQQPKALDSPENS